MIRFVVQWFKRLVWRLSLEQTQATLLVLSDRPPKPVGVLFFFGRARGDDNDAIFRLVADTCRSGLADCVLINGSNGEQEGGTIPGAAWAGKDVWTERLAAVGVEQVQYCEPAWNTADEARKMLAAAKVQGWRTGAVLAQPHQLLRCVAGLIRAMLLSDYWMEIYCLCPRCNWFEKTCGSQGEMPMPRLQHIWEEYSRIAKYAGSDLATLAEVIAYYKLRDTR